MWRGIRKQEMQRSAEVAGDDEPGPPAGPLTREDEQLAEFDMPVPEPEDVPNAELSNGQRHGEAAEQQGAAEASEPALQAENQVKYPMPQQVQMLQTQHSADRRASVSSKSDGSLGRRSAPHPAYLAQTAGGTTGSPHRPAMGHTTSAALLRPGASPPRHPPVSAEMSRRLRGLLTPTVNFRDVELVSQSAADQGDGMGAMLGAGAASSAGGHDGGHGLGGASTLDTALSGVSGVLGGADDDDYAVDAAADTVAVAAAAAVAGGGGSMGGAGQGSATAAAAVGEALSAAVWQPLVGASSGVGLEGGRPEVGGLAAPPSGSGQLSAVRRSGTTVRKNKLVIIMVGLPGRGKTFLCNKLCCYLNW